jgi:NAD(P)-dependent dehydrogenase (short-subunit alcohol dehydrogenase family)
VSKRILAVQALEAQGAQVLTAVADVTDRAAMQTVLDDIYAKFGALNGVIHAAGLVGAGAITPIQGLERAACDAQFAPKMEGLLVIEDLLTGRDPRLLPAAIFNFFTAWRPGLHRLRWSQRLHGRLRPAGLCQRRYC